MWAVSHFRHLLYGNTVKVYTDHTSVKAVLESPNPTAKHARWWTRVYGCGVKDIQISYRAGRENKNADALSRSPYSSSPAVGIAEGEVQVASVTSQDLAHEDAEITPRHDLTNTSITAVTFGQDETAYEQNGESATSRQKSTASKAGPSNSTAIKELPKSGVSIEQTTSLPDSDAERSTSDEATLVQPWLAMLLQGGMMWPIRPYRPQTCQLPALLV